MSVVADQTIENPKDTSRMSLDNLARLAKTDFNAFLRTMLATFGPAEMQNKLVSVCGMNPQEAQRLVQGPAGIAGTDQTTESQARILATRAELARAMSEQWEANARHNQAVAEKQQAQAKEFLAARTHEERVRVMETFFMQGGTLGDAVKQGIIKEEDKRKIEDAEEKARRQAGEYCDSHEAATRADLERRGLSKREIDEQIKRWRADETLRQIASETQHVETEAHRVSNTALAATAGAWKNHALSAFRHGAATTAGSQAETKAFVERATGPEGERVKAEAVKDLLDQEMPSAAKAAGKSLLREGVITEKDLYKGRDAIGSIEPKKDEGVSAKGSSNLFDDDATPVVAKVQFANGLAERRAATDKTEKVAVARSTSLSS